MKNKRLKICYIANPNSIHTKRWLRYFADQGHKIHLISLTDYNEKISGVICHDLKVKFEAIPKLREIEKVMRLKRLIKRISPDIIHAHYILGAGYLSYLSGFKPLTITAWGSDIYLHSKQTFMEKILTRRTLQNADLITTDSKDLRNKAMKLGAPKEKSYIIQFGVDTTLFHPGYAVSSLRRELKIRDNEKIIFSPRMMEPIYNIDNIVRAFKLLQAHFSNLKLILKSYLEKDEGYKKYIEELVKELGIREQTIFIGQVKYSAMARLYNLSDVVVSISSTDSSPMSVLEAMACGCNVVASDIPSLHEWIRDGWNGCLANVEDPKEISRKIEKCLLIKFDERQKIIERNLDIIKKKADYYSNMEKMEELYYSLTKGTLSL